MTTFAGSVPKQRISRPILFWVVVLLLGTIAIWFGAWWSVFLLQSSVPEALGPLLGQTGDMFGAANALFSGFGFAGILVVLLWDVQQRKHDLRDRRQSRRPFLVPRAALNDATASQTSSQIIRAKWKGTHFEFVVGVNLQIENLSTEPALNVSVTATVGELTVTSHLGLPVNSTESEYVELRLTGADSDRSQEFAKSIDRGAQINVKVDYESLDGVLWTSGVNYTLFADDYAHIGRSLDKNGVEYIEFADEAWGGNPTNQTYLEMRPKPGTWKQSTAD